MNAAQVIEYCRQLAEPYKADKARRFFKTAEGEYAHGELFWGISTPQLRQAAKQFQHLALPEVLLLLQSEVNELRLLALFILVQQYAKGSVADKQLIVSQYLAHIDYVNQWNLIDSSAHLILGPHLQTQPRELLYQLAESPLWWQRRIAILTTLHFIRLGDFTDTLQLAERLLSDPHELMHKAVGWMLREVGNRERSLLNAFLARHYQQMPRTMLRYAIEKYPENERRAYLRGER